MLKRLASLYAIRVVNVNVNILAAGLLALGPVLGILKLCESLNFPQQWLWVPTLIADVVCDVIFYYGLHFLANHAGRPARHLHGLADAAIDHTPFFKDATKVQFQRGVLSPILYTIWLSTQWFLMTHENFSVERATTIGFFMGVGTSRVLHTIWMLLEARVQARRRARAATEERKGHPVLSTVKPATVGGGGSLGAPAEVAAKP